MAGMDKDFTGEAWHAEGAKVGYLPQEPKLDETLSVRGNVMLGVAEKKAVLDRYNELAMNYSDETAEEMGEASGSDRRGKPLGSGQPDRRLYGSAALPSQMTRTSRTYRVVKPAAWPCANCYCQHLTCCSSMSRPTTWTLKQSHGCNST